MSVVENSVSHVEFRPIFDFGDHCVVCAFADAQYYGIYYSLAGEPTRRDEIFDEPKDALLRMFEDRYDNIRKWYNGNEIMKEVLIQADILTVLTECEFYDEEALQEIAQELGLAD